MFNGAIWESGCHANAKGLLCMSFAPLVTLILIPFSIHFFGFGALAIALCVVTVLLLAAIMIFGRKAKWINPKLIFALSDEGVLFTSKDNNNSFFNESYANMQGYSFKDEGEFTTIVIYFKIPANAGAYGNLKSLSMVKVENGELAKKTLEEHGVNYMDPPQKKANA